LARVLGVMGRGFLKYIYSESTNAERRFVFDREEKYSTVGTQIMSENEHGIFCVHDIAGSSRVMRMM